MRDDQLVFTVYMEPAPIYITQDAANPYINPTISLVFRCYDKSDSADVKSNLIPVHTKANSSYIDVYCIWEKDEKNLLCTVEEAKKVRIIKMQGCEDWTAEWNSASECWRFFTPRKLEREFMVVFGLDGLITSASQGTALMYATPMAITGLETYAFSIGKRYPVSIRSFTADPSYVLKGEETELIWDTANAASCTIKDMPVNRKDSKKYTVTQETDFTLCAANAYNQEKRQTITVGLTNWEEKGQTDLLSMFQSDNLEKYDLRLFGDGKSLYFFADYKLYQSEDSGVSFQTITPDADVIKLLKVITSNYYTAEFGKRFFIIGDNGACSFDTAAKKWAVINCNLMISKGGGAFLHRETLYFATMVNDGVIAVFAYTETPESGLYMMKSINIRKTFGLQIEVAAFEVAAQGDEVYFGIKDKKTEILHLLCSYDLDHWRKAATVKRCTGWFRLMTCNDRLLLLTQKQMSNPLDSLEQFPNFLPLLKDGQNKPVTGAISSGERDKIVVIAQRREEKELEKLWTFRTI